MPKVWVWWVVFSLGSSCLEGLHLTIYELRWRDETSGGDDLKGTVQWDSGQGRNGYCANNRCPVRAGHAVYIDAMPLCDVGEYLVQCVVECLVSVRDVTEIALSP